MLDRLRGTLRRLRDSFSDKAEKAYKDRDAAKQGSNKESFAAGEAQAYGDSSDRVRDAEGAGDK